MKNKIEELKQLHEETGCLKLILYIKTAINMGHDAEDIWHLLDIYYEDKYGDGLDA